MGVTDRSSELTEYRYRLVALGEDVKVEKMVVV